MKGQLKKGWWAMAMALTALPLLGTAQMIETPDRFAKKENKINIGNTGVGKKGEWYLSWGYNKEWYTGSNLHIKQPKYGNDFTVVDVRAHDHPGWDDGLFQKDLTIPQYNYRLGYYFKDNWAVEINFDHTKYVVGTNQLLHVRGQLDGQAVDTFVSNRPGADGRRFLEYQLNNGANFLLFNLVHRKQLTSFDHNNFDVGLLLKGGVGILVPHVQTRINGRENNPDFQFGGFDAGAEAAVRMTFKRYVYLEYSNKVVGAAYSHLHIGDGSAKQTFGAYEMILSLGVALPGKSNR